MRKGSFVTTQALEDAPAAPLGQDTAPAPEVAPLDGLLADLVTESAASTDGTETATLEGQTDSPDLLADYDDEVIKSSPRAKAIRDAEIADAVKSAEARQAESFRQRQENAEREAKATAEADAYSRNLAELDQVERGAISQTLYGIGAKLAQAPTVEAANELLQAEWPTLQGMAQTVQRTANLRHDRLYLDATNSYLADQFPNYAIPPELVGRFDAALHAGDYAGRQRVLAEIIRDAVVKDVVPKERSKIAADLKREAEAELKLTRDRQAEQQAAGTGRPTAVSGRAPAAGRQFSTRLEVAQAHSQGELTNTEARSWYARGLPET